MNQLLSTITRTLVAVATLSVAAVSAQAQGVTGDAQAGSKKADMCIGCHGIVGYQNSFPEIHKVPMISGQSDKYIVAALTAYKKGDRKKFLSYFAADRTRAGENSYDSNKRYDERNKYAYTVLPRFAHTPVLRERCIDSLEKPLTTKVYVLRTKKGEPYDSRSVRLKREGQVWKIDAFF